MPFKKYFDVEAVKKYHRVIPMEDFFASKKLSNAIWPESKRKSFCHSKRQGLPGEREHKGGACYAKSGNPFESFWDTYNIDFVGSELYGEASLNYDVSYTQSKEGTYDVNIEIIVYNVVLIFEKVCSFQNIFIFIFSLAKEIPCK